MQCLAELAVIDSGIAPSSICVRYFGTFEWGQLKPGDVVPFADGLHAGLHAKCTKRKPAFVQALQHVGAGDFFARFTYRVSTDLHGVPLHIVHSSVALY